ncbi:MotA/TolQ/ExbB proton channel family protein, partial [bacterium]|nr:MotA/TolQ/ExbB proton channel family protein [bacterium]
KILGLIPAGATMFESDLVKQIQQMWVDSMRNTQLNADLFTENKLTVKDISRIRTKLAGAATVSDVKTAIAEARLTEMTGARLFYKGAEEEEEEDIVAVKRSVIEKLNQIVELTPDKKKPAEQVKTQLDQCFDRNDVEAALNKHGFSPGSILKSSAASGMEKSPTELRDDVSKMLDVLEEMQETLGLNGQSNGQTPLSGTALMDKEREYEQFLWKHFGEPIINDALALCEKNRDVPLCQIYESGIRNHKINRNNWWASQEIDRSVDRTAAVKFEERRGVLDWLWAIGSLSPMFGLGGTVWGISQAFGKIKGVTDTRLLMQKLAGDINIALSTTIVGLVLGVLAFLTYYYTKYFLDQQAANIEKHFTEITNEA